MHLRNSCFYPLGKKGVEDFLDFDVPNVLSPSAHKVVDCMCLDQILNVFQKMFLIIQHTLFYKFY
jgi:hypothetical protein